MKSELMFCAKDLLEKALLIPARAMVLQILKNGRRFAKAFGNLILLILIQGKKKSGRSGVKI